MLFWGGNTVTLSESVAVWEKLAGLMVVVVVSEVGWSSELLTKRRTHCLKSNKLPVFYCSFFKPIF